MRLYRPVCITPRLLAGVQVDGASVSIGYAQRPGSGGRVRYRYCIDLPDGTAHEGDDLHSGCQGGSLQAGLACLLSFLSACGESAAYALRTGRGGENADLFPTAVAAWAMGCRDELGALAAELDEGEGLIAE